MYLPSLKLVVHNIKIFHAREFQVQLLRRHTLATKPNKLIRFVVPTRPFLDRQLVKHQDSMVSRHLCRCGQDIVY